MADKINEKSLQFLIFLHVNKVFFIDLDYIFTTPTTHEKRFKEIEY